MGLVPKNGQRNLYEIHISPRFGSDGTYTGHARDSRLRRRRILLDFAFLAAGTGFFLIAIAYVAACARM